MRAELPDPAAQPMHADDVILHLASDVRSLRRVAGGTELPLVVWSTAFVDDVLCCLDL